MRKLLNLRAILFGFLMLLLVCPMLNQQLGTVESSKLLGDVRLDEDTPFTFRGWLSGAYQAKKGKFYNDNLGFHPDLVRINNQLDYSLFKKLHANTVVVGKEQYFYESGYIKAFNGRDYKGYDSINDQLTRLKFIQDTLNRAGKQLVLAFIPSKGRYFPEYFPDDLQRPASDSTNYGVMKKVCTRLGIHYIDLNGWFLKLKPSTPHPLFTKQGTHWSRYAADLAADTFNRYLESLMKIDMPDMNLGPTECTDTPEGTDRDIVEGLNLIWPVTHEEFCYHRHIEYKNDSTKTKPRIIFISDSFFWTFIYAGVPQNCYKDWQTWFYFRDVWSQALIDGKGAMPHISEIDWMRTINESDAVVLFFSEPSLGNLGKGFIEEAYTRFGGK